MRPTIKSLQKELAEANRVSEERKIQRDDSQRQAYRISQDKDRLESENKDFGQRIKESDHQRPHGRGR